MKKASVEVQMPALEKALWYSLALMLPLLPLFGLGLARKRPRARTLFALVPIVGFVTCWALVDGAGNFAGRFQYPILPIALSTWPVCIDEAQRVESRPFSDAVWVTVGGLAIWRYWLLWFGGILPGFPWPNSGLGQVGMLLAPYADKGYVLAASEAGQLPFHSHWRTIDTWGLNDRHVAVTLGGRIDRAYVERTRPDVIEYDRSTIDPPEWTEMTETLRKYAIDHEYFLAGDFGAVAEHTQVFWVRRDCPDGPAIAGAINEMRYQNWTNFAPPLRVGRAVP